MSNQPTVSILILAIAGIGVKLVCEDGEVMKNLQSRYRDFLGSSQVRLKAEVIIRGHRRSSPLLDTGVNFDHQILHFTSPGYQGFIDPRAGKAELRLSSQQPAEEIEYFLRMIYALLAFENGGFLFHAAGIVKADRAFLFFGHSGTGKTTAARVSKRYKVLNDDLLLLIPEIKSPLDKSEWMAYATPFWNPTQVKPTAQGAPVAGLYRLVQNTHVYLEPMSKGHALAEFVSNVPVIPDDPGRNNELLLRGSNFLNAIPAYRLHFLPDDSFWKVIAPD